MSNAIRVLEVLGQGAKPSRIQMGKVITAAELDDQQREALLTGDMPTLGGLLGARVEMVSLQYPGDGDEDDDAPRRDDDQEEPERKEDEE